MVPLESTVENSLSRIQELRQEEDPHRRRAGEELMGEIRDYVYDVLKKMTTTNKEVAQDHLEDVTQDVIMKLLRIAHTEDRQAYHLTGPLKSYLYRMARNTYINSFRRQKWVEERTSQAYDHLRSQGRTTDPEDELGTEDIMREVRRLPRKQCESLQLHMEGYRYQEIATMRGECPGTIKTRVFYARKALQESLQKNGIIQPTRVTPRAPAP